MASQGSGEPHHTSRRPSSKAPLQSLLSFRSDGQLSTRRPTEPNPRDRDELVRVSKETLSVLPGLLLTRPDASPDGHLCKDERVGPLDQNFCPNLPQTRIRVINADSIDAAVDLAARTSLTKPVCVLNMANEIRAGGGFRTGALAQEEALCYRSSLYMTLKSRHYPIPPEACIYSPTVLVIRENLELGHRLLDCRDPRQLPVIAVVSAAAVFRPETKQVVAQPGQPPVHVYANRADRRLMRTKMRIVLRTTIRNRHRQVVLGALGCGAFQNPPQEVAELWAEVLQEPEFSGGWWEDVVFAVLSDQKNKNFWWFEKTLEGLQV
ncbi:hypothetical protein PV10_08254 [Exophiala mesophila]|uniref:Microbial-type PARG catalytic domain-containing protein n=1 Tax=Exophiala mesophila TaxID=212818 RepID=A0A0D1Z3X3_EXOME|nr:uncharacterized protein PV10_08254 [Exophiala mesophila]KIV88584.1 hypothetical protein PV10_08254 [Exophiala mesophila]